MKYIRSLFICSSSLPYLEIQVPHFPLFCVPSRKQNELLKNSPCEVERELKMMIYKCSLLIKQDISQSNMIL